MEVTSLTFNIKDVVTIVIGIGSFLGFYYALKSQVEKVKSNMEDLEDKQEKDHQAVLQAIKEHKDDSDKKEELVYKRINEIRDEQKDAHGKLEQKIDDMAKNLSSMNTNLSEIAGYIKAKKEG